MVPPAAGDATPLTLTSGANPARTYATLRALESDAFMARIWGGIHFRQAMLDAYRVGHVNAHRVARGLNCR